jgi:hypothetical protein
MIMPVEFIEFKTCCESFGYHNAIDQRSDKTPANIYSIRTRNGVKVEIKATKKITSYVAGWGLNSEKLDLLKTELESQGMVILKYNPTFMYIKFSDDILNGFITLVKYIEDIDSIFQRKAGVRGLIQSDPDSAFIAVAELINLAIKYGRPEWLGRGNGTFDSIDNLITVGYSINGRLQENSGKNAYREHIVPCTMIERKAIEMFKENHTVDQVADMIKQHLFILRISDEEAYQLDVQLGLKTTMPNDWQFGGDPFARIHYAGIILENNA